MMSSNTFRFLVFCGVLIALPSKLLESDAFLISLLDYVRYDNVEFSWPTPVVIAQVILHRRSFNVGVFVQFTQFVRSTFKTMSRTLSTVWISHAWSLQWSSWRVVDSVGFGFVWNSLNHVMIQYLFSECCCFEDFASFNKQYWLRLFLSIRYD